MPRNILITGALGNIGRKVAAHLGSKPDYRLTLVDLKPAEGVIAADLAVYDPAWTAAFAGVDTVIHFAGEPRPTATWAEAHRGNVLGTQNVLRAAKAHGIGRVIFASTNQIMGGYRFRDVPVGVDTPPAPLNPYAVSKLICEELGRGFAAETGASFLACRIGHFQPGENLPGPWMRIGVWGQEMWLSNRDMLQAMDKAVTAEFSGFHIINLVSNNPGMRWDLEPGRRLIGYEPLDGNRPVVDQSVLDEDNLARRQRQEPGYWLDQFNNKIEG